jgi:glycosyltransferase involved in cell wall biosynthesis
MPLPLVSVIVPVWNMSQYLGEALRSVFSQDYRPLEVIVVDDGSADGSGEVARAFSEVVLLTQENRGVAAARNRGIEHSHGTLIAFLDADDVWHPSKLSIQVAWLEQHPEIGYVTAHFQNVLEDGVPRPAWLREDQLVETQKGGVPNLLCRRSVFEAAGHFDPAHRSGSDLDWVLRAKDAHIASAVLPEVLLRRRVHRTNQSYQWRGGKSMLLRALKASIERQRSSEPGERG